MPLESHRTPVSPRRAAILVAGLVCALVPADAQAASGRTPPAGATVRVANVAGSGCAAPRTYDISPGHPARAQAIRFFDMRGSTSGSGARHGLCQVDLRVDGVTGWRHGLRYYWTTGYASLTANQSAQVLTTVSAVGGDQEPDVAELHLTGRVNGPWSFAGRVGVARYSNCGAGQTTEIIIMFTMDPSVSPPGKLTVDQLLVDTTGFEWQKC